MRDTGWAVTLGAGVGPVYEHYFDAANARSVCGRSDRSRVSVELVEKPSEGKQGILTCQTCLKALAKRERSLRPAVLNVGKDKLPSDRMSCAAAVELMAEQLGDRILTANALYNRVWRVANAGADPRSAPEFISSFGRIYFTREAVMKWLVGELANSKGVDLSSATPELKQRLEQL